MTAPTGQHGVFAVELLDQERLQETQHAMLAFRWAMFSGS